MSGDDVVHPGGQNCCLCCDGPGSHIYVDATEHDPEALIGRTRDSCCSDWCKHGALCCNSLFCTSCVMGQIFEKLVGPSGKCCKIVALLVLLCFIPYVGGIISWLVSICLMCQIVPVFVRRYRIPPSEQHGCCALAFCQPCMLAQMARHIEDFDKDPMKSSSVCCGCCMSTMDARGFGRGRVSLWNNPSTTLHTIQHPVAQPTIVTIPAAPPEVCHPPQYQSNQDAEFRKNI